MTIVGMRSASPEPWKFGSKFVAPAILKITTHFSTSQAVKGTERAIHPRLRVFFDETKITFWVCMPFVKKRPRNNKAKQAARAASAGPAPPHMPPAALPPPAQWRPTPRLASLCPPGRVWNGTVSRPSAPPFSVWPTDPQRLMIPKSKAGPAKRRLPKEACEAARGPDSVRTRRPERATPLVSEQALRPLASSAWVGSDSGPSGHDLAVFLRAWRL